MPVPRRRPARPGRSLPVTWIGGAAAASVFLLFLLLARPGERRAGREPSAPALEASARPEAGKVLAEEAPLDPRWEEAKRTAERAIALMNEAEAARSAGDASAFQSRIRKAGDLLDSAYETAIGIEEVLKEAGKEGSAFGREVTRTIDAWDRKRLVIHKTRAVR